MKLAFFLPFAVVPAAIILIGCSSWGAASAEEYFSIGMAYYDMGKYDEAEKWLNRAKARDKTKNASEYNLGRIAFEMGRYEDAAKQFDSILKRDQNNVIALKAAAYTQIRLGNMEKAAELYERLLKLVPESADDGYNYALVLIAMEKHSEAEKVLKRYEFALLDNSDVLLLYARSQKAQGKVEAIDTYATWLVNNSNVKVRYEYAQILETHDLYARALDEYRLALKEHSSGTTDPSRHELRFAIARLLLIADSGSAEGVTEMKEAVAEGYSDFDAIEKLLDDERISSDNKEELALIVSEGRRGALAEETAEEKEAGTDDETEENAGGK